MNFDIKDVKSWATRNEIELGKIGFFANSIEQLCKDECAISKLSLITKIDAFSFGDENNNCYAFFLPLDAVKKDKPKKKYRPLKSIDEMDCLFDCSVMSAKNFITYRSKVTGEIYIELLFAVCRDKNDILRSINNIPVQDLFNSFEIRKNGEWLPFGFEVKDD